MKKRKIRIIAVGIGRTGGRIVDAVNLRDIEVLAGVSPHGRKEFPYPTYHSVHEIPEEIIEKCDGFVVFAPPEGAIETAEIGSKYGKKVVITTAGLSKEDEDKIKEMSKKTSIYQSCIILKESCYIVNEAIDRIERDRKKIKEIYIEEYQKSGKKLPTETVKFYVRNIEPILGDISLKSESHPIENRDEYGEFRFTFYYTDGYIIKNGYKVVDRIFYVLNAIDVLGSLPEKPGLYSHEDILM